MKANSSVDVVLVDDDNGVRWIIEQVLEMAGVSYASAATGAQGIKLITLHTPPLAIVDVKLGGMSGLDVARHVQSNGHTQILLVTGYANTIQNTISELPIITVMEKPFDIHQLLAIVLDVLNKSA